MNIFIGFCGVIFLLSLVFSWAAGWYQPCRKCGSRLTSYTEDFTPDASYGWRFSHPYTYRKCWRCGEFDVLQGIVVESFLPDSKEGNLLAAEAKISLRDSTDDKK